MVNIPKNLFSYSQKKLMYIVLIFFLISLFFSYLLKNEQWYSSLFQILASTALAVLATLRVIEASLRKDKERQWKTTKILTYRTILETFRDIFTNRGFNLSCACFVAEDDGNELSQLFNEIAANRGNVAVAMVKFAILIKKGYIKGDQERYKRDASEYIKVFKRNEKEIKKNIDLMTFSLIPRIQQFSEDDHINKKMLILEIYYRRFKEIADLQNEGDSEFIHQMIPPYAKLLEIMGLIYDDIQYELQQEFSIGK